MEQKRRRARLKVDTQQQLLLLRQNGAALGLKDFGGPCGEPAVGAAESEEAENPEEARHGGEESEGEEDVEIGVSN